MKVLVTGATGFLGRHLLKKLRNLNYDISISNTKIACLSNINNLLIYNQIKFDYIFHLAAKTKAGDYCLYHKGEQWIDNQIINTNILKYWKEYQPQAKMIAMGTSCSYSPNYTNLIESNYMLGEPDKGLYTYAMTKRMLLNGLQSLEEQYGLKWLYFIPSTLYGPEFELDDSHFIFDLIKKIHKGKNLDLDVELWGDGYQKRELIYIDDVINIIFNLKDLNNKVINLGSGDSKTIREFAQIICDNLNYPSDLIKYDSTKYVGVKEKKLNIDSLNKLLPENFNFTSLKDGLLNTIDYYNKKVTI
jgi:GDP-L-fucose synthase